jgi:hypothetical protein
MTRTSKSERVPGDMVQACVERFAKSVFESESLPDIPAGSLEAAAKALCATIGSGDIEQMRKIVGDEFIERLSRRWCGAGNGSRCAAALRHAADQVQTIFPTRH